MGEHADDILDGSCCQYCGDWFHDGEPPGHPRSCGCQGVNRTERNARKRKNYKRNRAQRLVNAVADGLTVGWLRHSEHHFSRDVNGTRIDWWPTSNKYMVGGKVERIARPADITAVILKIQQEQRA